MLSPIAWETGTLTTVKYWEAKRKQEGTRVPASPSRTCPQSPDLPPQDPTGQQHLYVGVKPSTYGLETGIQIKAIILELNHLAIPAQRQEGLLKPQTTDTCHGGKQPRSMAVSHSSLPNVHACLLAMVFFPLESLIFSGMFSL